MYDMYMYSEKIYVRERQGEGRERERASNRKLICNWSAKYIKYSMII